MFSVKLSLIPEEGELEEKGLTLALKDVELVAPFVGPGFKVDYAFRRMEGGQILARVKASTAMKLECSRCLNEFESPAEVEFLSRFEQAQEQEQEQEPDIEGEDLSVIFFEGDRLPLGEEIRQELLLKIPFAPLCSSQCKGLCPVCGGDRNIQACNCPAEMPPQRENPFAGLKNFFNQSKEN